MAMKVGLKGGIDPIYINCYDRYPYGKDYQGNLTTLWINTSYLNHFMPLKKSCF
jgi:hypothetical protein